MNVKVCLAIGAAALAVAVIAGGRGDVGGFAPLFVMALCPLSMVLMMARMHRDESPTQDAAQETAPADDAAPKDPVAS